MKEQYEQLAREIPSVKVLDKLTDFPYSFRVKLLQELLKKFNSETVSVALFQYHEQYIQKNRVNYGRIKTVLKFLCRENIKEETEHLIDRAQRRYK